MNLVNWYKKREIRLAPYLFISPNIILFLLFMVFPILFTMFMSFHEWSIFDKPRFIGMDNYTKMFSDQVFWVSLRNTVVFMLGTVPFLIILGLGGAVFLNLKFPFRNVFRSIFFIPVVISLVATGAIWAWMLNPDYGLINHLLEKIGLKGIGWLSSAKWAMFSVMIAAVWARVGYDLVIFLAGLQSIPRSLYEAADIDGASGWGKFWHITLPLLKPTTVFVLIIEVIHGFMVFDLTYTMTKGGPGHSTTVLVQYIYQKGIESGEMGYASTIGVAFFLILLVITVIQLRVGRESE